MGLGVPLERTGTSSLHLVRFGRAERGDRSLEPIVRFPDRSVRSTSPVPASVERDGPHRQRANRRRCGGFQVTDVGRATDGRTVSRRLGEEGKSFLQGLRMFEVKFPSPRDPVVPSQKVRLVPRNLHNSVEHITFCLFQQGCSHASHVCSKFPCLRMFVSDGQIIMCATSKCFFAPHALIRCFNTCHRAMVFLNITCSTQNRSYQLERSPLTPHQTISGV